MRILILTILITFALSCSKTFDGNEVSLDVKLSENTYFKNFVDAYFQNYTILEENNIDIENITQENLELQLSKEKYDLFITNLIRLNNNLEVLNKDFGIQKLNRTALYENAQILVSQYVQLEERATCKTKQRNCSVNAGAEGVLLQIGCGLIDGTGIGAALVGHACHIAALTYTRSRFNECNHDYKDCIDGK